MDTLLLLADLFLTSRKDLEAAVFEDKARRVLRQSLGGLNSERYEYAVDAASHVDALMKLAALLEESDEKDQIYRTVVGFARYLIESGRREEAREVYDIAVGRAQGGNWVRNPALVGEGPPN